MTNPTPNTIRVQSNDRGFHFANEHGQEAFLTHEEVNAWLDSKIVPDGWKVCEEKGRGLYLEHPAGFQLGAA